MIVEIKKGVAHGRVSIPPSKSAAHRYIICAALACGTSILHGMAYSEDILATLDCIRALGATVGIKGDTVKIDGVGDKLIAPKELPVLSCRESGSTLRFMIPIAMLSGGGVFRGTERLVSRGIGIYESLFETFADIRKSAEQITVDGTLESGTYTLAGNVSSQFISGLLFALPTVKADSRIEILPPFESRGYVDMTVDTLRRFGVVIEQESELCYVVRGGQRYLPIETKIEGDWSQAAFFYGLELLGGRVEIDGLDCESLQGDRVCVDIYEKMSRGYMEADLSGCPDLAPILFAMASARYGAHFTGTKRLAIKESNRAEVMASELRKLGAKITVGENDVRIEPSALHAPKESLLGHNDHRVVMALSVLATQFGATVEGAQAIAKSYPSFFEDMRLLGLEIREYDEITR
ncbi:MAG: 3-phosphoshikimate 1-carboxyvinyltransferase [Clostridia bacterium]|nr:3-phosphoshikimate 1-carboxyvinyltransferase [Clostridia bacterium]